MSTKPAEASLEVALAAIPTQFRTRLIKRYREAKTAFLDGNYDACGLRVGKLAEVVLRLLQHLLTGTSTAFGTTLGNFTDECRKLGQTPKTAGSEGLRVILPRALDFVYTLRNKRGIGHEAGVVDPNEIDASTCIRTADWIVCELVRETHGLSLEEAQDLLDSISSRQMPEVFTVFGKKRVLDTSLGSKQQALLLLYTDQHSAVPVQDLLEWTEYGRAADFKRRVLAPLHQARKIEYLREEDLVAILPPGIVEVEEEILPRIRGNAESAR